MSGALRKVSEDIYHLARRREGRAVRALAICPYTWRELS